MQILAQKPKLLDVKYRQNSKPASRVMLEAQAQKAHVYGLLPNEIEHSLYNACLQLPILAESYQSFQKFFDSGGRVNSSEVQIGPDSYSLVQLTDEKGRAILRPYTKSGQPVFADDKKRLYTIKGGKRARLLKGETVNFVSEGYISLPDDQGVLTLEDFCNSLLSKKGEFELYGSENPASLLKNVMFAASAIQKDVTEDFKKDIAESYIYAFQPFQAHSKDFSKTIDVVKEHEPGVHATLEQALQNFYPEELVKQDLPAVAYDKIERAEQVALKEQRKQFEKDRSHSIKLPGIASKMLAAGIMIGAASLGAALAKDVSAEETHKGRASSDPVKIAGPTTSYIYSGVMSDEYVTWVSGAANYHLTNFKTGTTTDNLDYRPSGTYGQEYVYTTYPDGSELYLKNIATKETKGPLVDGLASADAAVIYGDKIAYVLSDQSVDSIHLLDKNTKEDTKVTTATDTNYITSLHFVNNGNGLAYSEFPKDGDGWMHAVSINEIDLSTGSKQTLVTRDGSDRLSLDCADDSKIAFTNSTGMFLRDLTTKLTQQLAEPCIFYGDKAAFVNMTDSCIYLTDLNSLIKSSTPLPTAPLRFTILADTHFTSNPNAGANQRFSQMADKILSFKQKPDYVFILGDVANAGYGPDGAASYQEVLNKIKGLETSGIKVRTLPGNHDQMQKNDILGVAPYYGGLDSFFDNRLQNYRTSMGDRDIAGKVIVDGNTAFFGINTGYDAGTALADPSGSGLKNSQIQLLDSSLDSLDGKIDGKDTSGKIKIILMHAPAYKGPTKLTGMISNNKDAFLDILQKYNVNAVFDGHSHQNIDEKKDATRHITTASVAYQETYRNGTSQKSGSGLSLFVGKPQVLKQTVSVKLHCPNEVSVYDNSGKITPAVESTFAIDEKGSRLTTISVDYKPDLKFRVVGTADAKSNSTYGLEMALNSEEDNVNPEVSGEKLPTGKGVVHEYSIDWGKVSSNSQNSVTIKIDSNADGKFEKTVASGPNINPDDLKVSQTVPGKTNGNSWYLPAAAAFGAAIVSIGAALGIRRSKKSKVTEKSDEKVKVEKQEHEEFPVSYDEDDKPKKKSNLEEKIQKESSETAEESDSADYWCGQAKKQFDSQEYRLAEESISKAIALEKNPEFFYLRAGIFKRQGKDELARKAREHAKKFEKDSD